MNIIENGGVTAAKGYLAAGACAGIKKKKERPDMALVFSSVPCVMAGTFTTNVVKAAPVRRDMELLARGNNVRAVILNSGVANACTGLPGEEDNKEMAAECAKALGGGVSADEVLTASTGVIGARLPMDAIGRGAALLAGALAGTAQAGHEAACAIMTTDTQPKECAVSIPVGEAKVTIGGMAKGSGMIHPNMATMLSVITTDAAIDRALLREAVSGCVKDSFNMISVDRDTSTNDSCIVLANGQAGNAPITEKGADYEEFRKALAFVMTTLAKKMAADGEGASKLFEAVVKGARTKEEAVIAAKSIITSNLVKTAVYGNDANWGRILCAMGYSGVEFDPYQVDLTIRSAAGEVQLVKNGMATDYSEEFATKVLSADEVTAIADMKQGDCEATAWGCDLTYDYVKINADYRS